MKRRAFLGLSAGAAAGLAGCTVTALPSVDQSDAGDPADCPAVLDVERTVCPDHRDAPITIEQSDRTVSGDAWSLVVTVTNQTTEPVGLNPSAWSVLRDADGGWAHVAPDVHIEPWHELAPGARYAWHLTAGEDRLVDADQRVFLDLPTGRYAFAVPVSAAESLGAVATFELTG